MSSSYWERYRRRTNRRRFLQASAGAGLGAAGLALVGCGGDDDDDSSPTLAPGQESSSRNPAAGNDTEPVRGGVYLYDFAQEPPTIDPYGNASAYTKSIAAFSYSRLYKYKVGPGIAPMSARPTPDLAESAEPNEDGTEWVIKLKPGQKFHDVAPVNGREITVDDIKFSWGRLTAPASPNSGQVNFVESVDFPDESTIKFTLKSPNAAFLDVLADANLLFVMPTEAEGGFDPKMQMIGSGPWIMRSYQPSVRFDFDRNPTWNVEGLPYFDRVEVSLVPEYATRLANFMAGRAYAMDVNAEDLITVRDQIKDLQYNSNTGGGQSYFYFSAGGPAAQDPRIRKALSMAMNRDDLLELGYNVRKLKDAGFDVQTVWNNIVPVGDERFWLDPKSPDMGEGGANFEYNPAEARKLLEAAGADKMTFKYQYANSYSKTHLNLSEQQANYLMDVGFNIEVEPQDYNSKYITQTFMGNFDGIAYGPETPFPEMGSYLQRLFNPDDPYNRGRINDAKLWELTQAQAGELDEEKRKAIFKEAQVYHGEHMYYVPGVSGGGTAWRVYHPKLGGVDYYTRGYGRGTEEVGNYWLAT